MYRGNMTSKTLFVSVLLLVYFRYSNSARLLGVFPMPGSSHYFLAEKLMKALADAGHHVTMIAPYPTKNIPKNSSWEDIVLEGVADRYKEDFKNINMFEDRSRSSLERMVGYQNLMVSWLNATLYNPKVRSLLTPNTKFDAVIMAQFFNDAHKYFAHYFQCPIVLLSNMGAIPWVNNIVGNPAPPSYVPHFFNSRDFSYENFWARFTNLLNYILDYYLEYFHFDPLQNAILHKAFPDAPSVEELKRRTALVLINSHESLLEAVPLVPNMIQIGGFHIDPPKSLPKDLQDFFDSAKEGVVYFSMGSNIKAKEIPLVKRQLLFNVFRNLKQKVLWKFEDESIGGVPENVLIKSWMPQQDILAHPNVKLFITHGGLLSTTETIYHGVPVLAIPVFADQYMNAKKAEQLGYGLQIPFNDENFSEETLTWLLKELLTNPKYKDNAKRRSALFHDRPVKPLDSAVYWVEYIIRHNGAKHLTVAGVNLPIYKYLMLDVFAFILFVIIVFVYFVKSVLRLLFKIKPGKKQKLH